VNKQTNKAQQLLKQLPQQEDDMVGKPQAGGGGELSSPDV